MVWSFLRSTICEDQAANTVIYDPQYGSVVIRHCQSIQVRLVRETGSASVQNCLEVSGAPWSCDTGTIGTVPSPLQQQSQVPYSNFELPIFLPTHVWAHRCIVFLPAPCLAKKKEYIWLIYAIIYLFGSQMPVWFWCWIGKMEREKQLMIFVGSLVLCTRYKGV